MTKKDINDYLTQGLHGTRLPKQAERDYFLGTLRERIILVLSIGEVMSDKGLDELEHAMQHHPDAKLIFNGHIASHFQIEEKRLANKYNIPYSVIGNQETETDIGAVLTLDIAINRENIELDNYFPNEKKNDQDTNEETEAPSKKASSFISRIKKWLS